MVSRMVRYRSPKGVGNVELAVIVVALIAIAAVPLVKFVVPELDRWQRQVNLINALNSFQSVMVGYIDDNGLGERFIDKGLDRGLFALSFKLMAIAQLNKQAGSDDPAFCTVGLLLPVDAQSEQDVYVSMSRFSCNTTGLSCPGITDRSFGSVSGVPAQILSEFYYGGSVPAAPTPCSKSCTYATALGSDEVPALRLGIASFYINDPSIFKIYDVGSYAQNPETGSGSQASSNCLPPFLCAPPDLNDFPLVNYPGCPAT